MCACPFTLGAFVVRLLAVVGACAVVGAIAVLILGSWLLNFKKRS